MFRVNPAAAATWLTTLASLLSAAPLPAAAQEVLEQPRPPQAQYELRTPDGGNVRERMAVDRPVWLVGPTLDLTVASTTALRDEVLLGLSLTRRFDELGVGFKLAGDPVEVLRRLASDDEGRIQRHRFLVQLHVRYAFQLLGAEWLYGIGAQGEARIDNHFALLYVTPLELGIVLYGTGSHYVQLFTGVRVLAAGALINHFLIDPNGYDSDDARDDLRKEESQRAEPFIGLSFTRRID